MYYLAITLIALPCLLIIAAALLRDSKVGKDAGVVK